MNPLKESIFKGKIRGGAQDLVILEALLSGQYRSLF